MANHESRLFAVAFSHLTLKQPAKQRFSYRARRLVLGLSWPTAIISS